MKILYICAGTGSYYCGTCLRDLNLIEGLRGDGHEVEVVTLYLPLFPEGEQPEHEPPLFLGGINLYLQEKFWLFRMVPPLFDAFLNKSSLLRYIARKWGNTEASELGPLTLSMLQGNEGNQRKEIQRFLLWLKERPPHDAVCFSNALLLGIAPSIQQGINAPIFCTLQGEEPFLDDLPSPYREDCWDKLSDLASQVAVFIAVSSDYGTRMARRLNLKKDQLSVVHNGIDLDGFRPEREPSQKAMRGPVILFLARMCPEKGLGRLTEAFVQLHQRLRARKIKDRPRMVVAGALTAADVDFVTEISASLSTAGLMDLATFHPNISRNEKQRLLGTANLLVVPSDATESFGLYVLEALASGLPVLLPRHAAFPEILKRSGGGVLYNPKDPNALVDKLEHLLQNPDQLQTLGQEGRAAVRASFSNKDMALAFAEVLERYLDRPSPALNHPESAVSRPEMGDHP